MSKPYRKTISVDFDGTIVDHEFPSIGKLKPGVKEALTKLIEDYDIVISSCRSSHMFGGSGNMHFQKMCEFLAENEIPYTRVDAGNEGKVVASAYVDDRAIEFKDNWNEIPDMIKTGLRESSPANTPHPKRTSKDMLVIVNAENNQLVKELKAAKEQIAKLDAEIVEAMKAHAEVKLNVPDEPIVESETVRTVSEPPGKTPPVFKKQSEPKTSEKPKRKYTKKSDKWKK